MLLRTRRPMLLCSFPMTLQGQTALITGSGRGIGRAIALLFASEGASVFLTARTHEQLASTAAEITQRGGQVAFATADVANEDDCQRIADEARQKLGPVTILVNNAGHYGPVVPVEEYALVGFRQRDRRASSRRVSAYPVGLAGNVSARTWSNSEYFQPIGQIGFCLGISLRRCESRNARIDSRHRRGGRPQRCARERPLSRPRHRNRNVQGTSARPSPKKSASAPKNNSPAFSKPFCRAAARPPTKSRAPRYFSAPTPPAP